MRHSVTAGNDYALENLQNKDWQYCVEMLLWAATNQLTVFDDSSEREVLEKTFDELNYCKDYYQTVFDNIACFFHLYIQQTHDIFVEMMEEDIRREIYFHKP